MNLHHDDGCGAQKAVRCDDVVYTQIAGSKLVQQTSWMVCDACGDVWAVDDKFDPAEEGLTFEQLCSNEG